MCVYFLPHFCLLSTTLPKRFRRKWPPPRLKAKARRDGRAFFSLTYYLNYTRLVRTMYQLSIGAKLLMISLLRGSRRNWRWS
jgi:hypothetical protein